MDSSSSAFLIRFSASTAPLYPKNSSLAAISASLSLAPGKTEFKSIPSSLAFSNILLAFALRDSSLKYPKEFILSGSTPFAIASAKRRASSPENTLEPTLMAGRAFIPSSRTFEKSIPCLILTYFTLKPILLSISFSFPFRISSIILDCLAARARELVSSLVGTYERKTSMDGTCNFVSLGYKDIFRIKKDKKFSRNKFINFPRKIPGWHIDNIRKISSSAKWSS